MNAFVCDNSYDYSCNALGETDM